MAKVKIQGHASGTGVLTVTAPNTSTDRTITLPDATGTLIADNGSGNVGIGDTTPTTAKLSIDNVLSGDAGLAIKQDQASYGIDINQDGNGIAFHIDTAATTQPAIEVEASALTTGKAGYFYSNSADTSTRQLLRVTNDHASSTGTTNLYVDNDSTGLAADFHGAGGIRSATGIKFGTDTAAANTLDDYEEGTWSPIFRGSSGSAGSWAQGAVTSTYTKIGRTVHIACAGYLTNVGSWTGNAEIAGLPFASSFGEHSPLSISGFPNTTTYGTGAGSQPLITCYVGAASSQISFKAGAGQDPACPYSIVRTGYYVQLSGTYTAT